MTLKNPRGEERMVIPCCGSQHGWFGDDGTANGRSKPAGQSQHP